MKNKTFEEKVFKMRTLQKEYFRTRCSLTLSAARKAEKEVDDTLYRLFPECKPSRENDNHPKLFPQ